MNYIKLNTNLPNPTNIYHVEPKRFVLFVRLLPFGQWVFDKSRVRKKIYSRMNYIKLNTNLPNQTNHLICRHDQKKNPS